ncbi:hypothetical protein EDD11_005366 [Mortierella claussenii]|nr:hypothetical protein EDD11_005366 [Mortierella claussenii]
MQDDPNYGATSAHSRQTTLAAEPGSESSHLFRSPPQSSSQQRQSGDERSWLLGPRATEDPEGTTTTRVNAGSGSGKERRRNTWMFSPGQQPYTLLPTSTINSTASASAADMARRPKELPGQTMLDRQDTFRSFTTTSSLANNYNVSISARRNMLHRQNSFGETPNKFLEFVYWLKELTFSTDTTDEKVASTVLNVVNVFVDAVFCILYLVEASNLTRPAGQETHWLYIERSRSFWHLLVTMACYNFFTVCCSVIFSESKSTSLRSTRHIVSTLVALPFIISIFMKDGHELYVPYFLQSFALVSRVQQALNFYIDIGVSDLPMDPLKSKTIIFGMYIITLIYCAISAFQVAEYDQLLDAEDHNDLLKLLYFVLITMSTIGYGDLTPKNQFGYAIVILIITAVVSVFPFMISGIMDALAQAKAGEGIFKSGGAKFMIISGSLHSAQKLANVLNGFWFTNKEYSNAAFKIVILGLSEPSKDIQALLQSARYKNRVVYLKGTPLESKDLERIQARNAEGIFIIADRNSPFSPQEEDRHNTLSTLAFRNVSDAGIYTYNLLPETEMYQKIAATQVVCADELRQVLLAFNCLQQATATLILNMLHQHRPSEKFSEVWEAEYDDSLGNEFYTTYLNPIFDGKSFGFVSWFLYRRFQVILFGVRIRLQSGEYHTALNPGKDYRFQHNEQCIFIAQNPTDLDDINELSEQYLENFLHHLYETQQEDAETIGLDYHAKNFAKALLALSPKKCPPRKHRKARSSQRAMHGNASASYSRTAGPYLLHSVIPTITNEDDEIDVVPEISFMSGEESGAEQGSSEPHSPLLVAPKLTSPVLPAPTQTSRADKRSSVRSNKAERAAQMEMMNLRLQDDELYNLRIGYPPAPFPGAKVPLCILVDARNGGDRRISDMVISSWHDVLAQRKQKMAEAEAESERLSANAESTAASNQETAATTSPRGQGGSSATEGESSRIDAAATKSSAELGHILICSPNYDIFRLICTLRSSHLKQLQDVVVLCSRQPNVQEFKMLKCFPRLYFLIGDCLSRDDLERGAITRSNKYLFMRHPENAGVDGSFFDSAAVINRILVQQIFSDVQISRIGRLGYIEDNHPQASSTLTSSHGQSYDTGKGDSLRRPPSIKKVSLQTLNEGPQCVYELVEERSVEFLQIRKTEISIGRDGQCNIGPKRTVLDGAGGSLEHLCPESDSGYYGFPQQQPDGCTGNVPQHRKKSIGDRDFYHNPIYASGGVIVGGLLDHVLYQLYSNPSILQLIKLLCGIRTKADVKRDFHLFKQYGAGCYLECIPVPEGFGVKTMRANSQANQAGGPGSSSNASTSSSDSESSSDDDDDDMNDDQEARRRHKKHSKKHHHHYDSSFHRAASLGKQKISELFHHPHHHQSHTQQPTGSNGSGSGNGSIDSDYMYDNRHKNFLHLYEHLALDRGVIPIGLLRLQGDDPKTVHLGIGGSSRCYAITNPLLDTVLLDTDQVFVLTREGV